MVPEVETGTQVRGILSPLRLILALFFAAILLAAAGCKGGDETADLTPEEQSEQSLKNLSKSLTKHLLHRISVLTVVDNSVEEDSAAPGAAPPPGGTEESGERSEKALRRERLVRAALVSSLVKNSKFNIVAPSREIIMEFDAILREKNANSLSVDEARKAGEMLSVRAVITAFVEDEGKRIDLSATSTETGKVVFHDILVDWNYAKESAGEAE